MNVAAEFHMNDKIDVRVMSNDNNPHDKDKALSWTWRVRMTRDGQIEKESNSWSGLNAITEKQLHSLKQSVAALEILNGLNWEEILNKEAPNWEQYITTDIPKNRDSEFEMELNEADIEDAIANGYLLKGVKHSGKRYRGEVYFAVTKETPKQYTVIEIPQMYLDYLNAGTPLGTTENGYITTTPGTIKNEITDVTDFSKYLTGYEYSVRKETFWQMVKRPIEVIQ